MLRCTYIACLLFIFPILCNCSVLIQWNAWGSSEHGVWLWARWIFNEPDCRQRSVLSLNRLWFTWLAFVAPRVTGWTVRESVFVLLREEKLLSPLQSSLRPGALKPSYKMGRDLLYPKTCSWTLTTKVKNAHSSTPHFPYVFMAFKGTSFVCCCYSTIFLQQNFEGPEYSRVSFYDGVTFSNI
jgi:hypothetical protein